MVITIEARLLLPRGQTIITEATADEISALLAANMTQWQTTCLMAYGTRKEILNLILNVKSKCPI